MATRSTRGMEPLLAADDSSPWSEEARKHIADSSENGEGRKFWRRGPPKTGMHPRLLIKRKSEFLLFAYLTLVTSFLQGDSALICQVAAHFRSLQSCELAFGTLGGVAVGSLAVILSILRTRYLWFRQAAAASALYAVVFALVAYVGVSARLFLAPAAACSDITWDAWLLLAAACFTVVAASIFIAVLNMVTTQKADYTEVRLRIDEYLRRLPPRAKTDKEIEAQNGVKFAEIREAVGKAYNAVDTSIKNESAPAYRMYVKDALLEPLGILKNIAESNEPAEEYFKKIGYRDRGTVSVDVVEKHSNAQQMVERICPRRNP